MQPAKPVSAFLMRTAKARTAWLLKELMMKATWVGRFIGIRWSEGFWVGKRSIGGEVIQIIIGLKIRSPKDKPNLGNFR